MAATLKELLDQKAALEQKISELRASEMASAISKIHELIEEFGLTQEDIFTRTSSAKARKTSTAKVPPKYRDPVSGKTWSGRGLAPKWLAGRDKSEFLIAWSVPTLFKSLHWAGFFTSVHLRQAKSSVYLRIIRNNL